MYAFINLINKFRSLKHVVSVFRTLQNIYDGFFFEIIVLRNSFRNYFHKKSSIKDLWQSPEYTFILFYTKHFDISP